MNFLLYHKSVCATIKQMNKKQKLRQGQSGAPSQLVIIIQEVGYNNLPRVEPLQFNYTGSLYIRTLVSIHLMKVRELKIRIFFWNKNHRNSGLKQTSRHSRHLAHHCFEVECTILQVYVYLNFYKGSTAAFSASFQIKLCSLSPLTVRIWNNALLSYIYTTF